jgi:bifunctional UDP-N-acetylglucosamine pyrophosphorylase/glucosamine-1-phosphate N-acetyltransferase
MHKVILKVIETAYKINANPIITIIGYKAELVKEALKNESTEFILQKKQNGTAHAVIQCKERLKKFQGNILVLSGDVPFITPDTLNRLIKIHIQSNSKATVLTCKLNNPYGYGRIIKNKSNNLKKIVEHKDATELELKEHEINTGIYIFNAPKLFEVLPVIGNNNNQKEYYLTDVLNILLDSHETVFIENICQIIFFLIIIIPDYR